MFVQKFSKNLLGRDFVVGDIHGCYDLLDQALARVSFDETKDRLFSVGDLVDRGSRSADCLSYLKKAWFHAVRGNHEDMLIKAVEDEEYEAPPEINIWGSMSGTEWLKTTELSIIHEIKNEFARLPLAIEIETRKGLVGLVHAEVPTRMDWDGFKAALEHDESVRRSALWGRWCIKETFDDVKVKGVSRIFHGHVVQREGIKLAGNRFYIDTGAYVFMNDLTNPKVEKSVNGLSLVQIDAQVGKLTGAKPCRGFGIVQA